MEVNMKRNLCVLPSLSASRPKTGPMIATARAEKATANAHNEEPTILNPAIWTPSPSAALNKLTK